MGIKEAKKKIKEDIKKAGKLAKEQYARHIRNKKGWRKDPAPQNAETTVERSKHKVSTNSWLNDTGAMRKESMSMRHKVYNAPHGFTLRIEFRRKRHPSNKSGSPPTFKQLGKWWGHGNIERNKTYSGPIAPELPEKIDERLSHNITVRLAHEFDKLMKKSIKSL